MSKIIFITDRPDCYVHGIWFHRIKLPTQALQKRGHAVRWSAIGKEISPQDLEWADTVVFGRAYPNEYNPVKLMKDFKKAGVRVVYDMDDDFWEVRKTNPSKLVSNALKDQYEGMIKEADVLITPSKVLAKKFKKYFKKKVFICPNGVDLEDYVERPKNKQELIIGYMGASSHWEDLQLIGEVLSDLSTKHDFLFTLYGLCGGDLEAEMYFYQKTVSNNFAPERNAEMQPGLDFYHQLKNVKMFHKPFMPPELHPKTLSMLDFDIGLAPLQENEFNKGKSCIKYYEYASVGTVVLASNVLPYKDEVPYLAKNTKKDWTKKLEKLIVDKDFREKMLAKQQKWVKENRSLEAIGLPWEIAIQKDGVKGLTVAMQR